MKRTIAQIVSAHLLLAAFIAIVIFVPDTRKVSSSTMLFVFCGIFEVLYLIALFKGSRLDKMPTGSSDIMCIVWVLMIIWELTSTKWGIAHVVLVPSPENVFAVFNTDFAELAYDTYSSVTLLLGGFIIGMALGVIFGVICGWIPRLRGIFYPIANVFAPIPPTIYTPFLVVLMPTYRLASLSIILLGVFFPQFLNTILRVSSLNPTLVDNARVLKVGSLQMITRIILPYLVPDVLKGMRVSLTTAFLMLTFSEMLGATAGIGYYINNANNFANYTDIIAGIILCGGVVTVLNYLTSYLQRRFTTWH